MLRVSGPVFVFRASRPALVRPERERQRERRPGRRGGGASGPAGRLETVQKVLTRGFQGRVPGTYVQRPARRRLIVRTVGSRASGGLGEPCSPLTDLLYPVTMQRYRIELVDGKFHIDGFPDAAKLIAISPLVKYQPQQLADMILHHADLRFAKECLEAISSSAATSPLIVEALWRSAIVHYCKCFGEHGSARARLPYSKFLSAGLPRDIHKYFMDLRNKHLIHDVNAWTRATPMAVVGPSGRADKIEEVICTNITGETRNTANIRNLESLIAAALPWVESRADDLSARIKAELEGQPYDTLLAQPEPEPYYAPKAGDISKSR